MIILLAYLKWSSLLLQGHFLMTPCSFHRINCTNDQAKLSCQGVGIMEYCLLPIFFLFYPGFGQANVLEYRIRLVPFMYCSTSLVPVFIFLSVTASLSNFFNFFSFICHHHLLFLYTHIKINHPCAHRYGCPHYNIFSDPF